MDLDLQRTEAHPTETLGRLSVDGVFECYTLEDPIRPGQPKIQGNTAIAAAIYEVVITKSVRFGVMLPLLLKVPDFVGVRIHAGNVAKDTEGCILVGQNQQVNSITGSRLALEALQPKIAYAIARGDRVWIAITDPVHIGPRGLGEPV